MAWIQGMKGGYLLLMFDAVIPSRFLEYVIAAIIIIIAPGPSVLFIIARAISWGRKIAVLTVAGNVLGAFTLSTLVAFGIGPILERSELAYLSLQWAGGLYLVYLGIDAIRSRKIAAETMSKTEGGAPGSLRTIRDGFWVGVLNPKGMVFFAAVLPQFIDINGESVTAQLFFLGFVFCLLAFISDGAWGLLVGTARAWLATDNRRLEFMRATGGSIMVLLGLAVLYSAVVSR